MFDKEHDSKFEKKHYTESSYLEENHEVEVVDEERSTESELTDEWARECVQWRLGKERMVIASGKFQTVCLFKRSKQVAVEPYYIDVAELQYKHGL